MKMQNVLRKLANPFETDFVLLRTSLYIVTFRGSEERTLSLSKGSVSKSSENRPAVLKELNWDLVIGIWVNKIR